MKVVITDYTFENTDYERDALKKFGHEVEAKRCKTAEELIDLCKDADCVITQFAPIKAPVVSAMRKARAIIRYGIGVDNVDLETAQASGIPVCNVPDYCIDEVADHTLAFILGLNRGVVANTNVLLRGEWKMAWPVPLTRTLKSLTVGIVGFGRIGREVAKRLVAFKGTVLVFDPIAPASAVRDAGCEPVDLDQIFRESDLITLHCPSNAQTRNMINSASLAKMKKGVLIVNVGRGDLINPDDFSAALNSGQVAGAALDVWSPEPIPKDHPILKRDNVLLSPHIASVSPLSGDRLRGGVVQIAEVALRGELPPNIVNGVRTPRRVG